jgi:hypothetical protein
MNCQAFEALITDLARDGLQDEAARLRALDHAGSCPRCGAHLADEQALTALLKRARADGGDAPAHVGTAILSAYRSRRVDPTPAAPPQPVRRTLPSAYWGIAAALVLTVIGVTALRLLHFSEPNRNGRGSQATKELAQVVPSQTVRPLEPTTAKAGSVSDQMASSAKPAIRKTSTKRPAHQESRPAVEMGTDFILLTHKSELSSMESGQLVRVLLPRTALASYGLPINQERADKPVTAQVLISQDGVARAIRFLSDQDTRFIPSSMHSKK